MATSVFIWPGISPGGNFSGQMVGPAADNTAAPPFTFLGDLTTGYASSAAGTLSLVTAGTTRLSVNSTAVTSSVKFVLPGGTTFASGGNGAFAIQNSSGGASQIIDITGGNFRFFNSNGSTPAAGVFGGITGTTGSFTSTVTSTGASALSAAGANGQSVVLAQLTELTTIAAAGTTTTTIQMPANAIIVAVNVLVTTVIPTATSFSVGDSGSATRFSTANVGVAQGSSDPGTKAGAYYNATAAGILLTMNGGAPAANTGRVRVTIVYFVSTPPTT